jgi:hypothetical protein
MLRADKDTKIELVYGRRFRGGPTPWDIKYKSYHEFKLITEVTSHAGGKKNASMERYQYGAPVIPPKNWQDDFRQSFYADRATPRRTAHPQWLTSWMVGPGYGGNMSFRSVDAVRTSGPQLQNPSAGSAVAMTRTPVTHADARWTAGLLLCNRLDAQSNIPLGNIPLDGACTWGSHGASAGMAAEAADFIASQAVRIAQEGAASRDAPIESTHELMRALHLDEPQVEDILTIAHADGTPYVYDKQSYADVFSDDMGDALPETTNVQSHTADFRDSDELDRVFARIAHGSSIDWRRPTQQGVSLRDRFGIAVLAATLAHLRTDPQFDYVAFYTAHEGFLEIDEDYE